MNNPNDFKTRTELIELNSRWKPTLKRHSKSKRSKFFGLPKRYNKKQLEIQRYIRIALSLATGLISIAAIAGSHSMLLGSDEDGFPLRWLEGSIFSNYFYPALALGILVGITNLAACITNLLRRQITLPISIISGMMICCFVIVELITLKNNSDRPMEFDLFYLFWGIAILVCSCYLYVIQYNAGE